MPRYDHRCTSCGANWEERVPSATHPTCLLCGGNTEYLWRSRGESHGIQTDESFIGGKVIENLGDQPVTVYSRQELAQAMHKAGVTQKVKWVPGDKYLTNWAMSIDPYTLASAKALVERCGSVASPPAEPSLRVTTSIRTIPCEP